MYAKDNNLLDEPAFAWWAPHVIRKRERLIKTVQFRHRRIGYKFGVRIPTTIEEALAIDGDNENNLWENSTLKEMNGVRVAFDIKEKGRKPPPGYSHVNLMVIFDVKIDFTRKMRLVVRGDQTAPPSSITHS